MYQTMHKPPIKQFIPENPWLQISSFFHYSDVIKSAIASQITGVSIVFTQPFVQARIKESTKVPRHWPLGEEFTGEFTAQRASNAEMFQFDDVIMS